MKQAGTTTVVCTTLRSNIPLRHEWLLRGLTYFGNVSRGLPIASGQGTGTDMPIRVCTHGPLATKVNLPNRLNPKLLQQPFCLFTCLPRQIQLS